MSTLEEATANAARAAVQLQETQLREALNEAFPGWTLDSLKGRAQLVRVEGNPVETFVVDGVPLLEIWPVEWDLVLEADGWKYCGTQKFKKLR